MARIPRLADKTRISTNVQADPTLSAQEASAGNRQTAALASQVSQGLGQLYVSQKKEEEKASYTKASISAIKLSNDTMRGLDEEYAGTNYDKYAEKGLERLKKNNDELINNSPESIRPQLQANAAASLVNYEQKLRSTEAQRKSEYAVFETQDQLKIAGQDSSRSWDPITNFKKKDLLSAQINSSKNYDEGTKRKLNSQVANVSKYMVAGAHSRGNLEEMSQAVNDLKDPDMNKLFMDMDPLEKADSIARLERRIQFKQREMRSKVVDKSKNYLIALQSNTMSMSDPDDVAAGEGVKEEIMLTMPPEEAQSALAQIEMHETVNKLTGDNAMDIFNLDVDKASKLMSQDSPDLITGAAQEAKMRSVLNTAKRQKIQEFNSSPIDYLVKYDESMTRETINLLAEGSGPQDVESFMVAVDNTYDEIGLDRDKRKYLPSKLSQYYSSNLKKFMAAGDANSTSMLMGDIKNKMGDNAHRLYDELGIDKKIALSLEIDDNEDRTMMIKNVMAAEKGINPEFKQTYAEKDRDIETELVKDDFFKAMVSIDGGEGSFTRENAQAFLDVAKVEYKAARLRGAGEKDAREEAFSAFKKSYEIAENGSAPIPVKKQPGVIKDNIENFVDYFSKGSSVNFVDDLDLEILQTGNGVKLTKEETNDNLRNRAKWVYNKKSDSIRLLLRDENGRLTQVKKAGTNEGYKINMKDATKLWDDINNRDETAEKEVQKKQFVKRNFGRRSPYGVLR